jgi:hypothetical protein
VTEWLTGGHHGHPARQQFVDDRVAPVSRDQQGAVEVADGDESDDPFAVGAGDGEQHRDVVLAERLGTSVRQGGDVRVLEEQLVGPPVISDYAAR